MNLSPGTRLGPYEVLAPLGAGGMGAVFKARDTRLERVVAVKVILAASAADPEFRERFDREARAVSALDHPHICTLYDVGHERLGGDTGEVVNFIVMQFLEGQTLADRLARAARPTSDPTAAASTPSSGDQSAVSTLSALSTGSRGPIAIDVALRIAREVALALDAAHRRGIVHRDLKPGNVMLTKTGAKLLDFGLAKLAPPPVTGFDGAQTRTSLGTPALTGQGAILGTLHYMSPEQLEGHEVDARSDIFGFGAVLYEMLAGRRAFDSPSHAGVIAAIVGADAPSLGDFADTKTRLPFVARRALDRLLQKCFAKDPDDRWQSAADLADELAWINEERLRAVEPEAAAAATPAAAAVSRTRERVWIAIAGLATIAAVTLGVWLYPRPAPPPRPVTFTIEPPEGTRLASGPGFVEMSPDGQHVAFVTSESVNANGRLWIRAMGSLEATRIASGDGAWHPAWSPDSRSIVFTASGGSGLLKRVDLAGGPAITLAEGASERPAWSTQGVVLYTGPEDRLYRVADSGGTSSPITEFDKARGENLHAWPEFLPDGRRFLYLAGSTDRSKSAIYLASIDGPGRTHVLNAHSMVEYVPGYLIYQIDGTIMAQAFDDVAGRTIGDPMPIVEDVQTNTGNGRAAFSVSPAGTLTYRAGSTTRSLGDGTLAWFDAAGKRLGAVGEPARYGRASLSPDGRRLVASVVTEQSGPSDLVMVDMERGVSTRFTSDPANDDTPVWSPDSQSVVFRSDRRAAARPDLYIKAAGGATAERALLESDLPKSPSDFSPDGKLLLFTQGTRADQRTWALPMTGDAKPFQVFPGATDDQSGAQFSPDGTWIAYTSGPPAAANIYVQPFPANGTRERISTTTGTAPRWSADGRQLFFMTADDQLMVVDVSTSGGALRAGLPRMLFAQPVSRSTAFNVDPAGRRFLLVVSSRALAPEEVASPLTVVLNWPSTFRK